MRENREIKEAIQYERNDNLFKNPASGYDLYKKSQLLKPSKENYERSPIERINRPRTGRSESRYLKEMAKKYQNFPKEDLDVNELEIINKRSKYRNEQLIDREKLATSISRLKKSESKIDEKGLRVKSDDLIIEPPDFTLAMHSVRLEGPTIEKASKSKYEARIRDISPVTNASTEKALIEEQIENSKKETSLKDSLTDCWGCGAVFQSEDPNKIGFVNSSIVERYKLKKKLYDLQMQNKFEMQISPQTKKFVPTPEMLELEKLIMGPTESKSKTELEENLSDLTLPERIVCERCWSLKFRSKIVSASVTASYFKEIVKPIKDLKTRILIVKIVDLFDFQGSFISNFRSYVGNHRVLIVANKLDLIPKEAHLDRIKTWVHSECQNFKLKPVAVALVSSKSGYGVSELADLIEYHREGNDVYIMGSANVGKSTFVNLLIDKFKGPSEKKITVSPLPGTTLGLLSLPIGASSFLYDTPGIISSKQIYHVLSLEELKLILPKKTIKPSVYRLEPGRSLFIGGLARFDYIEGPGLVYFTLFASNELYVHKTSILKASELYKNHVGTILTPPFSEETIKSWKPLSPNPIISINNYDGNWSKAAVDIVFAGLGWISVTLKGNCKVQPWYVEGCVVGERNPLMPFESHLGILPNPRFNLKPSSVVRPMNRPNFD